jgi:arginine exporter protein ArgO
MSMRTPLQTATLAVGVVFLLVGVLGFIPGITTDYDTMTFASHDSEAALLGIFQVNVLHNVVHLLFGLVGLLAARTVDGSRLYLIGGGAIYAILWIYGLVIDFDSSANFVALNTADNWLHLALAVGMFGIGVVLARSTGARDRLTT